MNAILPHHRLAGASLSDQPVSFRYPEEAREAFVASADIAFSDGSRVSAAEVWDYLTRVGPEKYPVLYDGTNLNPGRLSRDVTLPFTLKHAYLQMTFNERLLKRRAEGHPIITVQGGQPVDPYYAAGSIALRPGLLNSWAARRRHGLNRAQDVLLRQQDKQKAYSDTSFEICASAGYEHVQYGGLPIDLIAPYTALRCSDISYGTEAHRHGPRKDDIKLLIVDYPLDHQKDKAWAVQYFADNLRRLVRTIDELTGRTTSEDDLARTIRLHNQGRRLSQEIARLWWSAEHPPTTGQDRAALFQLGRLEVYGDPIASLSLLQEARASLEQRVQAGHKAEGVREDAARLFVLGSCVSPNSIRVEEAGGVIVGKDDQWSDIVTLVDESEEPYTALARAALSLPYEQPVKERAAWTVEQIRQSRAAGVIFLYKWGCNTQSGIARPLVDEITAQSGVPGIVIEDDMFNTHTEQVQNRVNAFIEMVA